jgi:hypothetical protein
MQIDLSDKRTALTVYRALTFRRGYLKSDWEQATDYDDARTAAKLNLEMARLDTVISQLEKILGYTS